jgi:hypothetical protein
MCSCNSGHYSHEHCTQQNSKMQGSASLTSSSCEISPEQLPLTLTTASKHPVTLRMRLLRKQRALADPSRKPRRSFLKVAHPFRAPMQKKQRGLAHLQCGSPWYAGPGQGRSARHVGASHGGAVQASVPSKWSPENVCSQTHVSNSGEDTLDCAGSQCMTQHETHTTVLDTNSLKKEIATE